MSSRNRNLNALILNVLREIYDPQALDKAYRVRFSGVALGRLAQRLAQRLYTPLVTGSNPVSPTSFIFIFQ